MVEERFDDFLNKVDVMETELKEWREKYVKLENKLNETIEMTNQLILNVNGANQFICGLHNALHKAGLIADGVEETKKKADEVLKQSKDAFADDNEIIKKEMEEDIMEDVNFTIGE
jgi:uncharacterized protein YoxC